MKFLLLAAPVVLLLAPQDQFALRTGACMARVDGGIRTDRDVVDDLTQADVQVIDNRRPQTIIYFFHSEEPLDVVLLFDARGSKMPVVRQVSDGAPQALGNTR